MNGAPDKLSVFLPSEGPIHAGLQRGVHWNVRYDFATSTPRDRSYDVTDPTSTHKELVEPTHYLSYLPEVRKARDSFSITVTLQKEST